MGQGFEILRILLVDRKLFKIYLICDKNFLCRSNQLLFNFFFRQSFLRIIFLLTNSVNTKNNLI